MKTFPRVEELVPHRPPMLLIDEVVEALPEGIRTRVHLTPYSPFMTPSGIGSAMGLEYLAQSAAAWFGVLSRQSGGAPRAGMLVACRSYEATVAFFDAGQTLDVSVRCVSALPDRDRQGLVKFRGAIEIPIEGAPNVVAEGEFSVYL